MGALHSVYYNNSLAGGLVNNTGDSELGWAIGAGVSVNLPMIGAGDYIALQASYSSGASKYAGAPNGLTADAVYNFATGKLELTDAWQIGGGFTHFFTPAISSSITVSYADYDHYLVPDLTEWNVQGNVVWNPVSGLDIGAELEYSNQDYSNSSIGGFSGVSNDALSAVIRVQRTF